MGEGLFGWGSGWHLCTSIRHSCEYKLTNMGTHCDVWCVTQFPYADILFSKLCHMCCHTVIIKCSDVDEAHLKSINWVSGSFYK